MGRLATLKESLKKSEEEYQNLLSKSGGKDRISRYAKKKQIKVNSVYLRNLKTKIFNNYLKNSSRVSVRGNVDCSCAWWCNFKCTN